MRSTFFGVEISKRALWTGQAALDVVNHNTSNASTPGYSRQTANIQTTFPYTLPSMNKSTMPGQLGTGVEVQSITRVRDAYLDKQFRRENQAKGYWTTQEEMLSKIEGVFNEPSDSGFQTVMNRFWQSLQELAKNPQLDATRAVVRQRGVDLAEAFNHTFNSLIEQQMDINSVIKIRVDDVNNMTAQISELNDQIVKIESVGDKANDLRDKRDLLLDQLAEIINIQVNESSTGAVTVETAGQTLLQGPMVVRMSTTTVMGTNGQELVSPVWESSGLPVILTDGVIKSLVDARDDSVLAGDGRIGVQGYINQLNNLAQTIIADFNTQHAAGYDFNGFGPLNPPIPPTLGEDFFVDTTDAFGNWANTFAVHSDILNANGLKRIRASNSQAGSPGNGDNAIKLAQLSSTLRPALGNSTYEDYFKAMITQLGVDSQAAIRFNDNQELLVSSIDNRRQSISGVSLDEEMTSMIKFQKVYSAAARMMTTCDEMLDTIINGMGLVGR
jgi:flagellar hook-associated protein 1 FlgK